MGGFFALPIHTLLENRGKIVKWYEIFPETWEIWPRLPGLLRTVLSELPLMALFPLSKRKDLA